MPPRKRAARDDNQLRVILLDELKDLKSKFSFKSASNKKKYKDVGVLLDKVIDHIK